MKILKIFYIIAVLGILGFFACKEYDFAGELIEIKKEKIEKKTEFNSRLDENYKPRKADFYKEKK